MAAAARAAAARAAAARAAGARAAATAVGPHPYCHPHRRRFATALGRRRCLHLLHLLHRTRCHLHRYPHRRRRPRRCVCREDHSSAYFTAGVRTRRWLLMASCAYGCTHSLRAVPTKPNNALVEPQRAAPRFRAAFQVCCAGAPGFSIRSRRTAGVRAHDTESSRALLWALLHASARVGSPRVLAPAAALNARAPPRRTGVTVIGDACAEDHSGAPPPACAHGDGSSCAGKCT